MNLFELFVKIGVDDQASGKLGELSGKLGNGLKTAAKVGTAAVGVASASIVALTKTAVEGFAEYEQLAGGAQKIFDQMDYSRIEQDAQNAYKTMNISASQYLATMNDVGATFAATMGDEAGYNAAKTGLQAIADYASGTGKSVDVLSEKFMLITRSASSYQSIADQFSGILPATSEGFLEQAQAAGVLSDSYTELTQVPIDEYQAAVSQMLEQGVADLGLAGNTAKETETTISGSLNAAKSAWQNLVVGIADENANFEQLVENFVDSAIIAAENIIPRVGVALQGAGQIIDEVVPAIIEKIPDFIEKYLPKILESGVSIVLQIVAGIIKSVPQLVATVPKLFSAVVDGFQKSGSEFMAIGTDIVEGLWNGIASAGKWIKEKVTGFLSGIVVEAKDFLGIRSPSKLFRDEIGKNIGLGVAEGLEDSEDEAVKAANDLAESVYDKSVEWLDRQTKYQNYSLQEQLEVWESIQDQFIAESRQYADAEEKIFDLRQQIQEEFYDRAKELTTQITDLEQEYQDTLKDRAQEIFNSYGLFDAIPERQKASGRELIQNLEDQIAAMEEFYRGLDELSARGVGDDLVDEIREMGPGAIDELSALLSLSDEKLDEYAALYREKQALANQVAVEELSELRKSTTAQIQAQLTELQNLYNQNAPNVGLAFSNGLASGIRNGMSSVINSAVSVAQAAVEAVEEELGIHSPSRVFAGIGSNMALGLGKGWDDEYERIQRDITKGINFGEAHVGFADSKLGITSANMINSVVSAETAPIQLTAKFYWSDGREMASLMLGDLIQVAKANGTSIANPT